MRIEHAAMYVNHLEEMRDFYLTYFQGVAGPEYYNSKTGFRSFFLSFADGARLELMTRPDLYDMEKTNARTGYMHLAFSAGSREEVDRLTGCLREAGFSVISGPRVTGDGYYESCILDQEGNQIEITI